MGSGKNKQLEMLKWRNEGMAYALSIAKRDGIDALEKIVKQRYKVGFTCKYLPQDEVEAQVDNLKSWWYIAIVSTFLVLLHDDHGFGKKRATELAERFLDTVDSTIRPELGVSIEDYIKEAEKVTGMQIGVPARWRQE